ncbi:L,D-transpeptidase family protein [Nakamurella endophytica]|uniref:YkuD domain-containing protein n=1 Tax=Nakamurella endophytica TaxID=1748367 RepID=A0A917SLR6_9ACTN|nr:hypothetical protein [Nakamurella endophytica]GGL88405.1 hypothetical protein GCM10011594_05050 [Nakamurella endophytica]
MHRPTGRTLRCLVLLLAVTAGLTVVAPPAGAAAAELPPTPAARVAAGPHALPAAVPSPAPAASSQLVTVNAAAAGSSYATLSAWQRNGDGTWTRRFGPVAARVGGAGIGRASEGSELTPGGVFPLTVAFGRLPDPGTRMDYFRTDPLDWWDENPASPTYNLHVRRDTSPGGASENLYYSGSAYNYAVNIGYNLARTPGAGSAFFLHVNTGTSTAGCVSIDQGTLAGILRWLDPAQHPYIDIRVGAAVVPAMSDRQATSVVYRLYRGILRRDPNPAALATYRRQLTTNAIRTSTIAGRLATAPERTTNLVTAAYRACLQRPPTAGERSVRTVRLNRGGTLADLYTQVCGSREALTRAGSPGAWVSLVSRFLLGRAPGRDLAAWVARARTTGVAATVRYLVGGTEFGVLRAQGLFHAVLGRGASHGEAVHFGRSMPARGTFTLPPTLAAGREFFLVAQG